MKADKEKVPLPRIMASIAVDTKGGRYFESCPRCNGHPVVSRTYVPLKPVTERSYDVGLVLGFAGGILPVYLEDQGEFSAACSCGIGNWRMRHGDVARYDSIPGTSVEDTKHSLVMAHWRRIVADARAA